MWPDHADVDALDFPDEPARYCARPGGRAGRCVSASLRIRGTSSRSVGHRVRRPSKSASSAVMVMIFWSGSSTLTMPNLIPLRLDDQVLRQDQLAGLAASRTLALVKGRSYFCDHLPQERQTVVQVPLAEPDGVVAPSRRSSRTGTRVWCCSFLVAVAEQVARIDHQDRHVLVPNTVQIGGPPGQPATLLGLSATGLDLALDVGGVDQGEVLPAPWLLAGPGADRCGQHQAGQHGSQQDHRRTRQKPPSGPDPALELAHDSNLSWGRSVPRPRAEASWTTGIPAAAREVPPLIIAVAAGPGNPEPAPAPRNREGRPRSRPLPSGRRQPPGAGQLLLHAVLQALARHEGRILGRRDGDRLTRLGVATGPLLALAALEGAEARDLHPVALGHGVGDDPFTRSGGEESVDSALGGGLAHAGLLGQLFGEFRLVHYLTSFRRAHQTPRPRELSTH